MLGHCFLFLFLPISSLSLFSSFPSFLVPNNKCYYIMQLYPRLFARVKHQVLAGSFHPIGGSWVENDANMPSGEALIRQMVFGQRYFETRFGKRCEVAWLPDSFGLTGALPQLIRGAGEFNLLLSYAK
jgi:alpha-mannosidase